MKGTTESRCLGLNTRKSQVETDSCATIFRVTKRMVSKHSKVAAAIGREAWVKRRLIQPLLSFWQISNFRINHALKLFLAMKLVVETKIPATFVAKKRTILSALAVPNVDYTDLSPKGSIDEGIRELIKTVNGMDGIVTTSSCAGRISIFLEGAKSDENRDVEEGSEVQKLPAAVPGGKGRGGRWLFVSHDPVKEAHYSSIEPIRNLYGMSTPSNEAGTMDTKETRFVKFQFEPMVSPHEETGTSCNMRLKIQGRYYIL